MTRESLYAGEMNQQVEIYTEAIVKNDSGENRPKDFLLCKKWVKRIDARGTEEEDGRLVPVREVKYLTRFCPNIQKNGTKFFIRDFDGDFQINSVAIFGNRRKSFLEIKAEKRGE